MGDRKKNVDAVFRNALSGLQTKPDEQVWERISDKLDKKKKSVFVLWSRWAAAIFLLVGVAGVFYVMDSFKETGQQKIAIQERPSEKPASQPSQPTKQPVIPGKPESNPNHQITAAPKNNMNERKQITSKNHIQSQSPVVSSPPINETREISTAVAVAAAEKPQITEQLQINTDGAEPLLSPEIPSKQPSENYTVRVVSRGYALQPEKDKLVDELETKIGIFFTRVDEGFGELQDAKNTIFASLTTRKDRKNTK